MVFPVVMYGCESWTVKKAEHRRTDAFEFKLPVGNPAQINVPWVDTVFGSRALQRSWAEDRDLDGISTERQ